jgi:hypothetical protein
MPVNKFDQELINTIKAQRVRKMLANSDFSSRKLSTIAATIGESETATETILRSVGARKLRNRRTGVTLYALPA